MRRWVWILMAGGLTVAASAGESLLSPQRWSEPAYGLSLAPPAGARTIEATADGAAAKFVMPDGTTFGVYVRKSNQALGLAELPPIAVKQFTFSHSNAVVVKQQNPTELRPAGRASTRVLFAVPDEQAEGREDDGHGWIAEQVFMLIDPFTIAMFQVDADADRLANVLPVFEAMVNSVELAPVRELEARRTALIEAGDAWRAGIKRETMKRGLIPEQWFRVVRDNRDVGYMRVRQSARSDAVGVPGIGVEVRSHVEENGFAFDTFSEFFESDDRETEIWSVKTSRRVLQTSGQPSSVAAVPVETLVETGVRSDIVLEQEDERGLRRRTVGLPQRQRVLTVDRALPSGAGRKTWQVPPKGYMSQVDLQLLPHVVSGRDRPREMLVYAYNSNTGTLTLRHEQVEPLLDGAYLVRVRPSPEAGEQVSTYDRHGRLLRRQMADGTVLLPATAEQIKAIHGIR